MALQGTLDTFALPDVLRLLAATKKSGRLDITGNGGDGAVTVASGAVASVTASRAPQAAEPVDALFELLRFTEGSFTFDADAPVEDGPGSDVEELLTGAESVLAEWREIEAVVPSLDSYVRLRRTIDGASVKIPAASWEILASVAGGTTVGGLGETLSLAEMPVSRVVRDLVELGVVELTEPPAEPAPAAPTVAEVPEVVVPDVVPEPPAADDPSVLDVDEPSQPSVPPPPGAEGALPVARPIKARARNKLDDTDPSVEEERFVPIDLPGGITSGPPHIAAEPEPESDPAPLSDLAAAFPGLASTSSQPTEEEAELARQLSTLSPRGADAVRAAAEATTDEERDAALDEATEDAPINRGLLLKFLSSVKS